MAIRRAVQRGNAAGLVIAVAMTLSGCDYWPPALQTQIEQLRSELQAVTMEKAQLQNQMSTLAKVKDDLQIQVEDLSRLNRDKSTMIASLQSSVTALQERLARSSKPAAAKATATKAATKPAVKTTQKATVKKKTAAKSVVVR
jgi:chromosome segregation ATPase